MRVVAKGKPKERTAGYPALVREGKAWPIALEPYALRVFEIPGGGILKAEADGRSGGAKNALPVPE
ncbi:MAG: hypothetical protein PHR35_14910 [Kiritimatiellae bacterium]|nr:hypothetical protein [Kiritimatiellia bacterium]